MATTMNGGVVLDIAGFGAWNSVSPLHDGSQPWRGVDGALEGPVDTLKDRQVLETSA